MREFFCNVGRDINRMNLVIYLGMKEGGDVYLLHGQEMIKMKNKGEIQTPTLEFSTISGEESDKLLISLIDGLINHGIKPTISLEDTSQLKAVKYHLEDMRRICFEEPREVNKAI